RGRGRGGGGRGAPAGSRPARYLVDPKPDRAASIAAIAAPRSVVGRTTTAASSEKVTTATSWPGVAPLIASPAIAFARSNRPGADMLYEVSSATTEAPVGPAGPVRWKKDRAHASVGTTRAVTR